MKASNFKPILLLTVIFLWQDVGSVWGSEARKLSIDTAVSMALEANLNLKLYHNEVEIGEGIELMENGAFDPHLEAGVSGGEQKMTSLLTGTAEQEESILWTAAVRKKMATGTEVAFSLENSRFETDSSMVALNPSYSSAIGLSLSQPLLKGNGKDLQTAGIRSAEKYTRAATFIVADQASALAAEVKKAYWELVYARQDIEVKKLSLKLARNLRDEISRKIENGVLAEVEIYQPDSEIARREELLIGAERSIAEAEDSLKLLINKWDWSISMIPDDSPEHMSRTPDLQTVLNNALTQRGSIMAGDLMVDGAEIMARKAKDDLRPNLALSGSAGMRGDGDDHGDSLDDTFSDPKFSWQVGLTFQMPFGRRTGRGGHVKARAELANARLRAQQLRQEVTRTARQAVRNVSLAVKTIEATRKTSIASQKRLEAEQTKFNVGLATANDVLEFQDSYARALVSEKRALIDLAKSRAELDRVQGIVSFTNRQEG